jgi:hypothetical protein
MQGQLFPQRMNDWMHIAMETIKEEAKRGVSSWLEDIRAEAMVTCLYHAYLCALSVDIDHSVAHAQAMGEFAVKRFENQVTEQYYEQDMLEKCGLPTSSAASRRASAGAITTPRAMAAPDTPRAAATGFATNSFNSKPNTPSPAALGQLDDPMKLPSLKVLNSDAHLLREKTSIHNGYIKKTLDALSPMLRILHVFRVMNQVPELAAFYNANRLVSELAMTQESWRSVLWVLYRCIATATTPIVYHRRCRDDHTRAVRWSARRVVQEAHGCILPGTFVVEILHRSPPVQERDKWDLPFGDAVAVWDRHGLNHSH